MRAVNLSALSGEDAQFLRRLEDIDRSAAASPRFTQFLSGRQLAVAQAYAEGPQINYAMFYGGFSDAARLVLGVFPPHLPPDAALFPVAALTLRYRRSDTPSHRDVLGALMGLRIARESIGDIVIEEEKCTVFLLKSVLPVVVDELDKVGRAGVRVEEGIQGEITVREEYEDMRITLSSPRIDALVSALTGLSREKSANLIRQELVQLEHMPPRSPSEQFGEGETLTVRGHGKFIVDRIGDPTRKGRLPVYCRKYK